MFRSCIVSKTVSLLCISCYLTQVLARSAQDNGEKPQLIPQKRSHDSVEEAPTFGVQSSSSVQKSARTSEPTQRFECSNNGPFWARGSSVKKLDPWLFGKKAETRGATELAEHKSALSGKKRIIKKRIIDELDAEEEREEGEACENNAVVKISPEPRAAFDVRLPHDAGGSLLSDEIGRSSNWWLQDLLWLGGCGSSFVFSYLAKVFADF